MKPEALAQTDGTDPQLLISVFTGRHSSNKNLICCDIWAGSMGKIKGRQATLQCKLMVEK